MKMQWTKQKPTEDGWYFARDEEDITNDEYEIIKIYGDKFETRLRPGLLPLEMFKNHEDVHGDVEYLGPIKPEHFLK